MADGSPKAGSTILLHFHEDATLHLRGGIADGRGGCMAAGGRPIAIVYATGFLPWQSII